MYSAASPRHPHGQICGPFPLEVSNWVWLENDGICTRHLMPKMPQEFVVHFLWTFEQNIRSVKVRLGHGGICSPVPHWGFSKWPVQSNMACKTWMSFFFSLSILRWRIFQWAHNTTMQQPHMDTLGHVHCSNTQRRHLKDSSWRPGTRVAFGSVWQSGTFWLSAACFAFG